MFKLLPLFLLLIGLSVHAQNHEVQQRVVEAFNKRAADDFLIGSSVGYIDQQGEMEVNLGFVTSSHDKFEIGSISKSFAGIILAQLVLESKVKLSTSLEEIIPDLKGSYAGSVTLKLLATHKARFVRDHPEGDVVLAESLIQFLKNFTPRPDGPATDEKRYSNLGFTTLGLVIAKITGKSYSEAVRERILFPLGMNETNFLTSLDEHKNLLTPHNILLQPTSADIMSDLVVASGGITSSLHDMMKFLRFNFRPNEAVKLAQQESLGFDSNPGEGYVWKNGGMTGFASLMLIDIVNNKASIVLSNSKNVSSTERLALTAVGVKDTYQAEMKIPSDFAATVVGTYFNEKFQFYMDVVTTKEGFLGFILSRKLHGDNAWATRLITEDLQKFTLMGGGWTSKDFIEFGNKEVILREFEKNDEDGKPVFFENIFKLK